MGLVVKRGFINKIKFRVGLEGEKDDDLEDRGEIFRYENVGIEMRKWMSLFLEY